MSLADYVCVVLSRYAVSAHKPGVVTRLTKLGFSHSITMDKVCFALMLQSADLVMMSVGIFY